MEEELSHTLQWQMDMGQIRLMLSNAGLAFVQVGADEQQSSDIGTPQHLSCVLQVVPATTPMEEKYPLLFEGGVPPQQRLRIIQPYVRWLRCGPMNVDGQLSSGQLGSLSFNHTNAASVIKQAALQLLHKSSDAYWEAEEACLRARAELHACPQATEVNQLVSSILERVGQVMERNPSSGLSHQAAHELVRRRLCALVMQSKIWLQ